MSNGRGREDGIRRARQRAADVHRIRRTKSESRRRGGYVERGRRSYGVFTRRENTRRTRSGVARFHQRLVFRLGRHRRRGERIRRQRRSTRHQHGSAEKFRRLRPQNRSYRAKWHDRSCHVVLHRLGRLHHLSNQTRFTRARKRQRLCVRHR